MEPRDWEHFTPSPLIQKKDKRPAYLLRVPAASPLLEGPGSCSRAQWARVSPSVHAPAGGVHTWLSQLAVRAPFSAHGSAAPEHPADVPARLHSHPWLSVGGQFGKSLAGSLPGGSGNCEKTFLGKPLTELFHPSIHFPNMSSAPKEEMVPALRTDGQCLEADQKGKAVPARGATWAETERG